tara:strand:- start:209 stop:877 length:669 start_codon:yes stop_codon:yes gene_type:complete
MNNPVIENFIIRANDVLTPGQNRFLKELIDNHHPLEQLPPDSRWGNKPTPNGKFWQPRADNVRKDSQFCLDPFWPQLSDEINNQIYQKLLVPYLDEYSVLLNGEPLYLNGSILLQKTEPTEGYHTWHNENGTWKLRHRNFAWMIYLNDVEEGGETEFLYQKTRFKPKTNMGLLWPGGFTHTHRGNPPLSETKYILTGWISNVSHDICDIRKLPPLQNNSYFE